MRLGKLEYISGNFSGRHGCYLLRGIDLSSGLLHVKWFEELFRCLSVGVNVLIRYTGDEKN